MTEIKPTPSADPEVKFDAPSQVMDQATWSPIQKRKALESWLFTVRSRIDAVSEGMNSHPGGAYGIDVELASNIEKAIATLPPATSTGGMLARP